MDLGGLPAVLDRGQEPEVQARQARELLRVGPVVLVALGVDGPELAGVGHQHLVAQTHEEPADPGRVHAVFDAIRMGSVSEKRLSKAAGLVVMRDSSIVSPLSVSRRHR